MTLFDIFAYTTKTAWFALIMAVCLGLSARAGRTLKSKKNEPSIVKSVPTRAAAKLVLAMHQASKTR
jgi:hypothetical protein